MLPDHFPTTLTRVLLHLLQNKTIFFFTLLFPVKSCQFRTLNGGSNIIYTTRCDTNLLTVCSVVLIGDQHEQPCSSQATKSLLGLGLGFDSTSPEHSPCSSLKPVLYSFCCSFWSLDCLKIKPSPKLFFFCGHHQIVLQDFPKCRNIHFILYL